MRHGPQPRGEDNGRFEPQCATTATCPDGPLVLIRLFVKVSFFGRPKHATRATRQGWTPESRPQHLLYW